MAPNADFDTFDENDETVMNSFLLSNIAPQHHGFNGGKIFKRNLLLKHVTSHLYSRCLVNLRKTTVLSQIMR